MNEFDEHSKKLCWCGGHNHSNPKKNKKHHSTKKKLAIRRVRKGISKNIDEEMKK